MKKIIAIILILNALFLLGCDFYQQMQDESYKASELAEKFCFALAFDEIEKAKGYLHPDWEANNGALEDYVIQFEQVNSIDFSNGVAIKKRLRETYVMYTNKLMYEPGIMIFVGDKKLKMYFRVIDNDAGYGIYDFGLDSDRPNP